MITVTQLRDACLAGQARYLKYMMENKDNYTKSLADFEADALVDLLIPEDILEINI